MLKLRKITTSVVAGLLVAVMSCSVAFAGQANSVTVKETNNLEATEENKNDIKETRKIRVTRSGKNFIVYNMQQLINENRAHMKGLVYIEEDGIYGPKTRNAFIRFWQSTVCEKLGYDAIAIDGIFGAKSKAISKNFMLRPQDSHVINCNHVMVVSAILHWYGYCEHLCAYYTEEMVNAVKSFQRDHGLAADGIVGPDTYYAIFNK